MENNNSEGLLAMLKRKETECLVVLDTTIPLTIEILLNCIKKLHEQDEERRKNDPYFGKYPLIMDDYEGVLDDKQFKDFIENGGDRFYMIGGLEGFLRVKARCERLNIKM